MANEITALEGQGSNTYRLLFLFPISTPVQVAGANVVPTPSAELPTIAQDILSQAEKDDLDAGTSAFRVVSFQKDPALTNPQLAARAREIYAAHQANFESWYNQRFQHVGQRFDATA